MIFVAGNPLPATVLFRSFVSENNMEQCRWLYTVLIILMSVETVAQTVAQLTRNLVLADAAGRSSYNPASAMGFMKNLKAL